MDSKNLEFAMIHHVDQQTIDEMYNTYEPVFILSTGRTGSKFLANLLGLAPNVAAFHEPQPTLEYFSDYAYHHQEEKEVLTKMIDAARMESILEVYIKGKIYVESNQCLTFFAPVLAQLYRKSKFVQVVRHPGDFVRSAIRKGWHKNDSIWESGRVKMADQSQWNRLDHIEKLGWLWNTTNRYIEEFSCKMPAHRIAGYRLEDLVQGMDKIKELLGFIGAREIPESEIRAAQASRVNEMEIHPGEPPNMKKVRFYPAYSDWDEEMKKRLNAYVGDLAKCWGY